MDKPRPAPKILVVEDDAIVAETLRAMLQDLGYDSPSPICAVDGVLERARAEKPDLILQDIRFGGSMDGIDLGRQAREQLGIAVIYVTGYDDAETLRTALETNPYGYLPKPVSERTLRSAIESALHRRAMEERLAASEQALRESEAKYRGFVQSLPGVAFSLAPDLSPAFVEGAVEGLTGHAGTELAQCAALWEGLIAPEDAARVKAGRLEALRSPHAPRTIEYRLRRKDGRTLWVQERLQCLLDAHGRPWRIEGTIYDVTEAREAQTRAQEYQEALKGLAKELSKAGERERRRIATELHDRIAQNLIALKMRVASAAASGPEGWAGALRETEETLDQIIRGVSGLCFEISSPILYHVGLESALEWLVEKWRARGGAEARFSKRGAAADLDHDSAEMFYQAVRELLNNCGKHAGANKVSVSFRATPEEVTVVVKDDGRGFCPAEKSEGYGLISIRERFAQAGGCCHIESAPGQGATIRLRLPRTPAAVEERGS